MLKKVLVAILLTLNLLIPAGCWNRREPETYSWVSWVALDKAPDDKIKLTVAMSHPLSPLPTGAALPEKLINVASSTGTTVFEAVRNMIAHVPKRLFWGHLRAVIISEDIARSGIEEYLDLLLRDQEIRRSPWVFVTKGSTEQIFNVNPEIEKNPTVLIDTLAKAEKSSLGTSRVIRLTQLQCELGDNNFDPVISVMGVWDTEAKSLAPPGQKSIKQGELALNGSAVFQGDKLVGWLSPDESKLYVLARGELKGGIITVPDPENPQNTVSLEIMGTKRKLKARVVQGKVKVTLKLTLKANLGDQRLGSQEFTPTTGDKFYNNLSKELEEKIQHEVQALVDKFGAEFQTDCLGVSDYLYYRYPKDWQDIEANWHENLREVEYTIEVKANVASPGTMRSHYPKEKTKIEE